jgi:hypothetical protein
MEIEPLTKTEKAWLKKAQKLFNESPERFEFLTAGDAVLTIVDKEGAKSSELCDGAAEEDGIVLGYIRTKGAVHGVSG